MRLVLTYRGGIPLGLGPNARGGHWGVNNDARSFWRLYWKLVTRSAMNERGIREPLEHVSIQVRGYFYRRRLQGERLPGYRPKDGDNLLGAMKAAIDGVVDAGLIADDTAAYVTHETPVLETVTDRAAERVEMEIVG